MVAACIGGLTMMSVIAAPARAEHPASQAARAEADAALAKTPNIESGRRIYLTCAVCHQPEGWGTPDGAYPQIAGQLPSVIIAQLAAFRSGKRENALMFPFAAPRILGGPQQMADVAAYVSQLPMTPRNGLGPGADLARGEALYQERCAQCHGNSGQGDATRQVPTLAAQHFQYLARRFALISHGNCMSDDTDADPTAGHLNPAETAAVLDFASRLRAAPDRIAADGWRNPDFPLVLREALLTPPPPPPMPLAPPPLPEPPILPTFPGRSASTADNRRDR